MKKLLTSFLILFSFGLTHAQNILFVNDNDAITANTTTMLTSMASTSYSTFTYWSIPDSTTTLTSTYMDNFDLVILLQSTSPLRTSKDIDSTINLLFAKKAKTLVSVCLSEHHPLWANTLTGEGFMDNFIKSKKFNRNRQELPVFYRPNGAIYLAFTKDLLKNKGFIGSKTIAYIMPAERSVDIDTKLDFDFAALLIRRKRKS